MLLLYAVVLKRMQSNQEVFGNQALLICKFTCKRAIAHLKQYIKFNTKLQSKKAVTEYFVENEFHEPPTQLNKTMSRNASSGISLTRIPTLAAYKRA